MTGTTAPVPSPPVRRLPFVVPVRLGSMQTRELIAQAVTGLNGPAGATMVLAAMKLVSVPMGTGALAGFAELLIGLAVILHVCVIEPLTLVRGVPVPAED